MVGLSHIHADHHTGLASILSLKVSWENEQDASGQGSTRVENYSNLGFVRVSNQEKGPIEKRTAGGQLGSSWLQSGFNLQAGLDEQGRQKLKNALSSLGLTTVTFNP
ncbi:hypothetical protein R1sor_023885 [Riccia sorocarpa]|uniref:Uncharacterized protein n=1 Tax=Riccia sorocarpa TaxID=122646 RepID=A0ABD3GUU5_9MARC